MQIWLAWIECHPGLASWLQAIFSVAAICVAVWLPNKQKADAEAAAKFNEEAQTRHLLRNLLDEMSVITEGFSAENGKHLRKTPDGFPFLATIPIAGNVFPIFEGCAGRLGQISNDNLRRSIIDGYARANAFIGSVRMNNLLLERFEQASYLLLLYNDKIHHDLVNQRTTALRIYADALKRSYADATAKIEHMCEAIRVALGEA